MDVHFETPRFVTDHGKFIIDDPTYWVPLMNYFFTPSELIEVHCWKDEEKVNNEIRHKFPELAIKNDAYMTIYKGRLTEKIIDFLTQNPLDEDGQVKWFSIFLFKNGKCHFSSEHFGTEFHANGLTEEQVEFIKSVIPKDTTFNTWE